MAISETLDWLSCELMGEVLDLLADNKPFVVVASIVDDADERLTCAFEDDSAEYCLEKAREWVKSGAYRTSSTHEALCYAIAYRGAVSEQDETDSFSDALLLEFGEKGQSCGWSAYSLISGIGMHDKFSFTDPAPAGETPCLL